MEPKRPHRRLIALGLVQTAVYLAVALLSYRFDHAVPDVARPILAVVLLLCLSFVLYLTSLREVVEDLFAFPASAKKLEKDRRGAPTGQSSYPTTHPSDGKRGLCSSPTGVILGFALLYRVVLWWSQPILETDFYRYLWDGRVLAAGISPYRYSPAVVISAGERPEAPPDLVRLHHLYRRAPATATIVSRIGYPEIPTVYPPAAQLLFAAAAWLTPETATIATHVRVLKGVLLLFDAGTIWLLLGLLRRAGRSPGWVLAYAWCPLVLKEFANTGRPDASAVFFCILAFMLLVPPTDPAGASQARTTGRCTQRALLRNCAAAACLAIATLVKLYPVILVPLLARWWQRRLGWAVLAPLAVYGSVLTAGAAPFQTPKPHRMPQLKGDGRVVRLDQPRAALPSHGLATGIRTFLENWEMNDFAFALVHENLRPVADAADGPPAWFAVTPNRWRTAVVERVGHWLDAAGWSTDAEPAFLSSALVTYTAVAALLLSLALWPWPQETSANADALLRRAFLCLAWFWILSPTQNPWYWTWALVLAPFAGRAWLIASGCVLLYYLRFWFDAHFPAGTAVWPTPYAGWQFFDYIVVWFEHLPILLAAAWPSRR